MRGSEGVSLTLLSVTVCCKEFQGVSESCSELQCVAGLMLSVKDRIGMSEGVTLTLLSVAVCCSELQ